MNTPLASLEPRYSAALTIHLTDASEEMLHAAYALGRLAAADGLGVVDLVMLHDQALRRTIEAGGTIPASALIAKATQFLAECLSPFEMVLSGYREANSSLIEANKQLNEAKIALEMANRELESFSYSVAHDLRAPLRSLDGFSQALLEDHADRLDDDGRRYLGYLRESARDMAALIDDLLALSRVTRGDFKREHVDISDLASRLAARLADAHPERRVDVEIAPGMVAWCDARLLAIALGNLIGNAWKFTSRREGARIEVGGTDIGGHPAWFVRDNGAGFDMAYAARLFGVFQRLHAVSEFEGTGIGLATVQRVIHRHRGQIAAEGAVGQGATFRFTLGEAGEGDSGA
jgi:light-regulated signal transduction histidine kinase (bacteriophytochrome)